MALLCDSIDKEPSTYEEAAKSKEWKYAMIEEYQSIMKNYVWEIVMIARKEVCCDFEVDLQDQACCRW